MVLSVFSPNKPDKSIYYTCLCVHYFKSYNEIDNILKTWRPFRLLSIFIDLGLKKNAIPFFSHHYYVLNMNQQKNHFKQTFCTKIHKGIYLNVERGHPVIPGCNVSQSLYSPVRCTPGPMSPVPKFPGRHAYFSW